MVAAAEAAMTGVTDVVAAVASAESVAAVTEIVTPGHRSTSLLRREYLIHNSYHVTAIATFAEP